MERASTNKVLVLTGGPGTGKTTVTKEILKLFYRNRLKVALCSPTGRAAERLSEATGMQASTIHRLLEFTPNTKDFGRNWANPLEVDAVIVDETSMVDVVVMDALLEAIPDAARLVLVGDVDQLQSVGAGSVLQDIIGSGSVAVSRLRKNFRQKGDSRIHLNAQRINKGELPRIDNSADSDFHFFEWDDAEKVAEVIVGLSSQVLGEKPNAHDLRRLQVLAPVKLGTAGVFNLNAKLQDKLNPEGLGARIGEAEYREGDKVIQIRNNYESGVFNGTVGIVKKVKKTQKSIDIEFDAPDLVTYSFRQLEEEIQLAYAMTVHKAQGSEFPVVVMPLVEEHHHMLKRNLLYTAVTRAKEVMVVVGSRRALSRAVNNDQVEARYSNLQQLLKEVDGGSEE